MKILIIGEPAQQEELIKKFGNTHAYTRTVSHREAEKHISSVDIVFDFLLDESPLDADIYIKKNITVFVNAVKISLADIAYSFGGNVQCTLFGFNGLPGFLEKEILEASVLKKEQSNILNSVCEKLQTKVQIADDRVGLVTPRVICMIINEAYYTVQEGTASREDIDLAMKLGTNYPYGPFEWAKQIGIRHIYEVLEAVYEDTKDERYKICPLLKKEYLTFNREE